MTDRSKVIKAFIDASGWAPAARELLAGDASNRSYDRLYNPENNHSAVLMNAPDNAGEAITGFAVLAHTLRKYGLSAPEVFACDEFYGLMLLEDLGDALYSRVCQGHPALEPDLYQMAVDVLLHLHQFPAPDDLPTYDNSTYLREGELLTGWYLPAISGHQTQSDLQDEYRMLLTRLCSDLHPKNPVLVLRDYHAENLMWLPERQGLARVGLLDFQDALSGHRAYDLVSLLEDARRDTSLDLQLEMKQRYLNASGCDPEEFERDYCILGAQRNLKIIGIFSRLCIRDGKFTYVDLIPRVWAHLQRDLSHPDLQELRQWVDRNVPPPEAALLQQIKGKCRAT